MPSAAKPLSVSRRVLGSLPPHTIVSAGFAKLSRAGAVQRNQHKMNGSQADTWAPIDVSVPAYCLLMTLKTASMTVNCGG